MRNITYALCIVLFLSSCKSELTTYNGETQGTSYRIIFESDPEHSRPSSVRQPVLDTLLKEFDRSLSAYIPGSVISRINRNDPEVTVDDYFRVVFKKSCEVWMSTGGAFDMTVGPLVNAYGFGPDPGRFHPGRINTDSLLEFVGMDLVKIENGKLVKKREEVQLDVNGIAQGYAVDVLSEFLEANGIRNYLVEIGGEIRARGAKPGNKPWKVGIDKPRENNFTPGADLQVILTLTNHSVATSGNYRKFHEVDGVKYGHSINPKTGFPVMDTLLSATVIAGDCMTADAYATAFMVMGFVKTKAFLSTHPEMQAYLVYSDGEGEFKVWHTKGMEGMIVK